MAPSFREILNSGNFVVTSEIGPPKGTNIEKMLHHIDLLKDKVAALNVTDHQSSVMRFPSLGGCLAIKERGGDPILQMTCRDRNRLALQAELLIAYTRGIRNVLCLTGDAVPVGDHKEAKGVFDLDSVQLLRAIRQMESGKDLGGNDLDGAVEFCAGAIVTPEARPIEPQLVKFEKNVESGAEFFQTGIFVPQHLIDELASAPKGEALNRGIEIAGQMIAALKKESLCDGVHIMAIGREEVVPQIMEAAGLTNSKPQTSPGAEGAH